MSWRKPSPRPAPAVTSFSPDPAFGGPAVPTHKPARTSTQANSAATLLARTISDDDDAASVRSSKSTATLAAARTPSGSRSASSHERRPRAVSDVGSVASTIAPQKTRRQTSPESGATGESESGHSNGDADASSDAGTRSASAQSFTSIKRQRKHDGSVEATSPAPRKAKRQTSTASPAPTFRTASEEPPPLSLAEDTAPPTEFSGVTSSSSTSPAVSDTPASRLLSPPPSADVSRSSSQGSQASSTAVRKGWFSGRSVTSPEPTTQQRHRHTSSPARSIAESRSPRTNQLALQQASARIVSSSATSTGWLSKMSRPSSSLTLGEDAPRTTEDLTTSNQELGENDEDEPANTTPRQNQSPADPSLTPKPSHQDLSETLTPARASWFGWGGSGASPSQQQEDNDSSTPEERSTTPKPSSAATDQSPLSNEVTATASGNGWLSSFWRSQPNDTDRTADAQAAEVDAPERGAVVPPEDVPPSPAMSSTASSAASIQDQSEQTSVPVSVQSLKPKASWSIFGLGLGGSNTGSPASSLPKNGMAGPEGASSTASTRSRASADNSAPNSPFLAPQQENPIKPLTGSVKNQQQRPAPYEPDPPFENLVLPTFTDTFERPPRSFPPQKSKLTRAVSAMSAYFFQQAPPLPSALEQRRPKEDPAARLPKALGVVEEPPRLDRVKRVVTIGVHGWFPTPKVKFILGEPTGTSVKFATMMHDAVQTYLESKDISSFNIQAIALEGHGQIDERVNKLYDQLISREEWVQAVKAADAVFLATHSQGSVASTQLLARMLDQGLIVGTKTHLLAMCAIAQGPFVFLNQSYALSPYFNYLESAPARELFEFQNPESMQARKFMESLRVILSAGIKTTVVGSINDQVVPLYSALFSGVEHPAILRAVYIDSQAFRTSDFLANLVVFSARLRNAGLKDHDLVYHVSEALAGALTGVGHSRIYDEEEVFSLAVRYHFEATTLTENPTYLDTRVLAPPLSLSFNPRDRRNPYLLTWALRGIIEDQQIRELFSEELHALREAYETWKPQTKVLKDVKLKLEGIRMLPRPKDGKL